MRVLARAWLLLVVLRLRSPASAIMEVSSRQPCVRRAQIIYATRPHVRPSMPHVYHQPNELRAIWATSSFHTDRSGFSTPPDIADLPAVIQTLGREVLRRNRQVIA